MLSIKEINKLVSGQLRGESQTIINSISTIENSSSTDLVFISHMKYIKDLNDLKAGLVITDKFIADLLDKECNLIIVDHVMLAFAKLSRYFDFKDNPLINSLDSLSSTNHLDNIYIGNDVKIGKNFKYGINCVIESGVVIGKNVCLSHNVILKSGSSIGDNVYIGEGTVIGSEGFGNILDKNANWHHISHLGGVSIGNNVLIGSNCNIDRGTISDTIISNGVVMDNQIHIAHNVQVGEKTAIAANVGIAGSCNIGKRNMIGGMVGIVDHISTVDDVIITAKTTVYRNIKNSGTYTGIMPILKHGYWKRISILITKLDKMLNFIKK